MKQMTQLIVSNVAKQFGGLHALHNVSFSIDAGELVAIIGPNGAGKSTLINVISGETSPTSGTVSFRDERISNWPSYRVNRVGLARTFQSGELFKELSVFENVVVGGVHKSKVGFIPSVLGMHHMSDLRRSLEVRANDALRLVGLSDRATQRAGILPAGKQRLLAIARAIASGADWLILDEPAAGLNHDEKNALIKVIEQLVQQQLTILFVEHDMRVVGELAHRIIVLDQGELIADGTPDVVRNSPRVVTAYLGVKTAAKPTQVTAPVEHNRRLMRTEQLTVRYAQQLALDRVSIDVFRSEIVAILGANGAGKSSILKAIMRTVPISGGRVEFDDSDVSAWSTRQVVVAGIALAPEGRELFASLSVDDNLKLGAYSSIGWARQFIPDFLQSRQPVDHVEQAIHDVFALFPRLAERRHQMAGTLSGGEGQMLAIGRALMSRPRLLLLDEPSLGLAPMVIAEIFDKLIELKAKGQTIILVEQNAAAALEISDRAYVMSTGRIVAGGEAHEILASADIDAAYLGESRK